MQSGLIQNNFSSALTPQHDYSAQVSGADGHVSYNMGGSWLYTGPWTPSVHKSALNGFGGARLQQGPVTADVSLRRSDASNRQDGSPFQAQSILNQDGVLKATIVGAASNYTSDAQTISLRFTYAPVSWWTHAVTVGSDQIETDVRKTSPTYTTVADTLLSLSSNTTNRTSLSYTTTLHVPISQLGEFLVTGGADGWHSLGTSYSTNAKTLTGILSGASYIITRQPDHDHGAFVQAQLGIRDALFLTYGLRAEWNPSYGEDANPNTVPRYGVAYTHDFGWLTTKLRGSYGHSTRPPTVSERLGCLLSDPTCGDPGSVQLYGDVYYQLPNPSLLPDQQQGGEGGLELYFGTRGSLIVTRYNQTVDNLTLTAIADSVDLLPAIRELYGLDAWSHPFRQIENVNLGSVRNQGWELQGSINLGPFTAQGTYSWVKSRVIGVTPKFREQFPVSGYPQYVPGAVFSQLPEHTYGVGLQYTNARTLIALNVQGQGLLYNTGDDLYFLSSSARLRVLAPREDDPRYLYRGPGYAIADLNVTRHVSSHLDALLQIQNLTDFYQNDVNVGVASIGRQTKLGARIRW